MTRVAFYEFGPFRLDVERRRLLRGDHPVSLSARTFDTLLALVEHRGELVEKDALMSAVWPDTAVEEGNLTQHISLLRKALGEQRAEHLYVATVARRGYRFVSPVRTIGAVPQRASTHPIPPARVLVGRDQERAALVTAFRDAAAGRGSMVCLAGEPGIGKTTVAEAFLQHLAADHASAWVVRGRCSERLAGSDAYLPLLEALESLLSSSPLPDTLDRMRRLAPAWLEQVQPSMPLRPAAGPPSQERLKRELTNLLSSLTSASPAVLFLEDLQWVDDSTADLLGYLASRVPNLRLLILCTCRSTELGHSHPFVTLTLDLQARGICRDVPVGFLTHADVVGYLDAELRPHAVPPGLADILHARSEGNPLFLSALVRDMRERGILELDAGRWRLSRPVPEIETDWPPSLRSMVERAINRVRDDARAVLTFASVQGVEFDSVTVARAARLSTVDVEEHLAHVERQHRLVRRIAELRLPGGAVTTRYAFVHVLYQNALHGALSRSRRAAVSGAVADAMRELYGPQVTRVAPDLAHLYAAADRASDAIEQLHTAARTALGVAAAKEAVVLTRRGLALVSELSPGEARDREELDLLITLGVPLAATTGYANPDVERTYSRARELAERRGDGAAQFAALWGLWVLYHVSAELRRAREIAEQLLWAGQRSGDRRILQVAHTVSGYTIGHMGEFELALDHLACASECARPDHHAFFASINALDPAVAAPAQEARLLCLIGEPDKALARVAEAIDLAEQIGSPNALGFALVYAAYVHQMRCEPQQVIERTEAALALATEHGLADVYGWGMVWQAWAQAQQGGAATAAIEAMQKALDAQRSFGSEIARPHQLALLADVLALAERRADALTTIEEALAQASRTGDRYYEPQLRRLREQITSPTGSSRQ